MIIDPPLPIGKVFKAHGLKGHLKVLPYGETLSTLVAEEEVTACLPDGSEISLTITEIRPHQKSFLLLSREINKSKPIFSLRLMTLSAERKATNCNVKAPHICTLCAMLYAI